MILNEVTGLLKKSCRGCKSCRSFNCRGVLHTPPACFHLCGVFGDSSHCHTVFDVTGVTLVTGGCVFEGLKVSFLRWHAILMQMFKPTSFLIVTPVTDVTNITA